MFPGHIQIAQVPDRHEPSSAGEIDYKYVLGVLEAAGYDGWIGLEYLPSSKDETTASLGWIQDYGYTIK